MRVGIGLEITRGSQQASGASGATLALDFQRSQYSAAGANYGNVSNLPGWSFTRASVGWAKDSVGNDVQFGSGVPRITDLGFLVEGQRTNFLLNSTAPATQTTGSLATGTYTLWIVGTGSAAIAAGTGTATGLGTATASAPLTITVTVAGTFTVTNSGSVTFFQLEDGAMPTSRIVTAGATATRAADIPLITGLSAPTALTLVVNFVTNSTPLVNSIAASFDDGATNSNRAQLGGGAPGAIWFLQAAGVSILNSSAASTLTTTTKMAMRAAVNDASVYLNGTNVASSASAGVPAGNRLGIGIDRFNAATLNGYIRSASLYPTGLPDGQLRSLTS